MPIGHGEQYDFFLSRRGSVAAIAREVADVLTEQDYDVALGASFIDAMHEAVKNSCDLTRLRIRKRLPMSVVGGRAENMCLAQPRESAAGGRADGLAMSDRSYGR
jgi:hypothetical protein